MKVFLDMVGCRLNQAELETIAADFCQQGFDLTDNPAEADYAVLNTCAVTAAAAADSRSKIRKLIHHSNAKVVVTGCWSDVETGSDPLLKEVFAVIPNREKAGIVQKLSNGQEFPFDRKAVVRVKIPGQRNRTRKFLKVQDGCDNLCTFCLTRLARGKSVSTPVETILEEANAAAAAGVQEIILTGVNLGAWGKDFEKGETIVSLVNTILRKTSFKRIRLSSLEPWDLKDEFLELWQDKRLCPHLHLPIQSGSLTVLRRMNRRTDPNQLLRKMDLIRRQHLFFSFTTDLICGFPGETDAEFYETLEFIRNAGFDGGHVFPYSERAQTAAARMSEKVPVRVRKERAAALRDLLKNANREFMEKMPGQQTEVLWESARRLPSGLWRIKGYAENYLPVIKNSEDDSVNFIESVQITTCEEDHLVA